MASPLYDAISVDLSKKLSDAVASATSDGDIYTSAMRDLFLNNAIKRWMLKEVGVENWNALRGYKAREGQALSNNSKALSGWTGGVVAVISAYNSTDTLLVNRLPDGYTAVARSGANSYYSPSTTNQFWQIEGASFILLDGGSTTGDTIVLEYIKEHTALSANGSSDTSVPSAYFAEILDLATKEALEERSHGSDQQVAVIKEAGVDKQVAASQVIAGR